MNHEEPTARAAYALAYEAHYADHDLLEALRLYAAVLTHDPDGRESRDARIQIRNITQRLATVPEVVQSDLALAISQMTAEVPSWFTQMVEGGSS